MKKIILQQDEKDCGVACLAMVFKHYNTQIPLQRLRTLSGTDLEGTSMYGLKKTAEAFHFKSEAIKANKEIFKNDELSLPLIAHVIVNKNYTHYVVIYAIKDDILFIADPAKGKIKKSIHEFNKEWTGIFLLMTPGKNYKPSIEKTNGLSSFLPIIWKEKILVAQIILVSLFITSFGIGGSYYFQGIVDYFVPQQAKSALNIVSIGLIIIYFFDGLLNYIRSYLLVLLGQRMSTNIMLDYIQHVFNLPMNFFSTRKSGEIVSRFLDANKIIDGLASITLSLFLDGSMILFVGIALFIQNKNLFWITLASIPFYTVTILSFVKHHEKANQQDMEAGAVLNSNIIESLEGIETIKSYNMEEETYNRINKDFMKLMQKSFKTINLDNIQQSIKQVIEFISRTLILWVGSYYVIEDVFSLGQLITYNALLIFFTVPLQNIINLQAKFQTAQVANNRLNEIFALSEEADLHSGSKKNIIDNQSNITLDNVSFSYGMKKSTLYNISCVIPSQSNTAIVGASGSGKSTLAKLLVKFYLPSEGKINYGTINYFDINHKALREHVTYVPQKSFFFSGTILDNLTFGLEIEPTIEEIVDICEVVHLTSFINQHPQNFDAMIEEGGSNLSGGQLQRLAIARALLKDADILILDEATSGLDPIIEHSIIEYLLNLKNKTVIFISHHLPIAKSCDQILVLNDGELVEKGTHEELFVSNSVYKNLWDIYSGE